MLPKALKGCIYTAHEQGLRDINACGSGVAYNFASGFFAFGLGFFSAYGTKAADDSRRQSCIDMAVMQSKATGYDCPQPGCPGFDAHAKGGAVRVLQVELLPRPERRYRLFLLHPRLRLRSDPGACHTSVTPC